MLPLFKVLTVANFTPLAYSVASELLPKCVTRTDTWWTEAHYVCIRLNLCTKLGKHITGCSIIHVRVSAPCYDAQTLMFGHPPPHLYDFCQSPCRMVRQLSQVCTVAHTLPRSLDQVLELLEGSVGVVLGPQRFAHLRPYVLYEVHVHALGWPVINHPLILRLQPGYSPAVHCSPVLLVDPSRDALSVEDGARVLVEKGQYVVQVLHPAYTVLERALLRARLCANVFGRLV